MFYIENIVKEVTLFRFYDSVVWFVFYYSKFCEFVKLLLAWFVKQKRLNVHYNTTHIRFTIEWEKKTQWKSLISFDFFYRNLLYANIVLWISDPVFVFFFFLFRYLVSEINKSDMPHSWERIFLNKLTIYSSFKWRQGA